MNLNRQERHISGSVSHIKMTICSLTVWIWVDILLPSLPPETYQVCQRNSWLKPSAMPLQGWQSEWIFKREAFISNKCTVFKTSTASVSSFVFSNILQPLMDCAVCFKTAGGQMETNPKPYVHCIQRPRLTQVLLFTSCPVWLVGKFLHKRLELFRLFGHFKTSITVFYMCFWNLTKCFYMLIVFSYKIKLNTRHATLLQFIMFYSLIKCMWLSSFSLMLICST